MKLDGKVVIVTGAGRGIGREIAAACAREGATVALVSRTRAQLDEAASAIRSSGGTAFTYPLDVTDRQAVKTMLQDVEKRVGPVDVLINNAGSFAAIGPVSEVDADTWLRDVTVNIFGPFLCSQAVLPGMIHRKRGIIINMIGGGTGNPFPYGSGYGSSKAALMRLTESMAAEVKGEGVAVLAMGPGLVRTAMTEYQVISEAGKTWLPRIQDAFNEHRDVPPTLAAELAAELATGAYNEFTGRLFSAGENLQEALANKDRIIGDDLRTLRIVRE
jgi:NAD(P)-dependent dehydrogenase (short-subunit alcohol dehydrogenase family)